MSLAPDYSFVFQLLIFVTVWLGLKKFLFDPVFKVLDARDKALNQDRSEADQLNAQADEWLNQCEDQIRQTKVGGAQARDEARQEALKQEQTLLLQARDEADQYMQAAREDLHTEVDQARTQVQEQVQRFSQEIVERALG